MNRPTIAVMALGALLALSAVPDARAGGKSCDCGPAGNSKHVTKNVVATIVHQYPKPGAHFVHACTHNSDPKVAADAITWKNTVKCAVNVSFQSSPFDDGVTEFTVPGKGSNGPHRLKKGLSPGTQFDVKYSLADPTCAMGVKSRMKGPKGGIDAQQGPGVISDD